MLNKIQAPSVAFGRFTKSVLALTMLALSFTACKDDDNNVTPDDGGKGNEKAFIPAKDQRYRYKITESDGSVATSVTKVANVKDSAGIPVYTIQSVLTEDGDDVEIVYKAYSHGGFTTNELSYPMAFEALVDEIKSMAVIDEFDITGFPQYQNLENKGTVNSLLTFKGDPIKLYMKLQIPVGEEDVVDAEVESRVTYKPGKATKEEAITTPAGTFNCTKWEYSYEVYTKFETEVSAPEESKEVYNVSLWTAPGVGIVKSIEKSEENTSTTELQTIEK